MIKPPVLRRGNRIAAVSLSWRKPERIHHQETGFIVSADRNRVACWAAMRLRPAMLFLLLIVFSRTSFAADAVSVRVSHFGLEGSYATPAEPTWVEVTA